MLDEFVRCYTPKTIEGTCHDYRANAGIDFEMDAVDQVYDRFVRFFAA